MATKPPICLRSSLKPTDILSSLAEQCHCFALKMVNFVCYTLCLSTGGLHSFQVLWPRILVGGYGSYTQQWHWLWLRSLALVGADKAHVWQSSSFEDPNHIDLNCAEFPGQTGLPSGSPDSNAASWDYYVGVPGRNLVCHVVCSGCCKTLPPALSQSNSQWYRSADSSTVPVREDKRGVFKKWHRMLGELDIPRGLSFLTGETRVSRWASQCGAVSAQGRGNVDSM